jgi:hypothetical protein
MVVPAWFGAGFIPPFAMMPRRMGHPCFRNGYAASGWESLGDDLGILQKMQGFFSFASE